MAQAHHQKLLGELGRAWSRLGICAAGASSVVFIIQRGHPVSEREIWSPDGGVELPRALILYE